MTWSTSGTTAHVSLTRKRVRLKITNWKRKYSSLGLATEENTLSCLTACSSCRGQHPNRKDSDLRRSYSRNIYTAEFLGSTIVEARATCTNSKEYTLRVYLPSDFPNSCPDMVVKPPSSTWFSYYLRKKDGSKMDDTSGSDHTLEGRDGYTKICHFRSCLWKSDYTIYQVIMKGLIWLEAYEAHLRTGRPLGSFLKEM